MKRVTLTLNPENVEMADAIAKTLSISRSALINQLLGVSLPPMAELFQELPAEAENGVVPADTARRLRGRSAAVVEDAVADALAALSELEAVTNGKG